MINNNKNDQNFLNCCRNLDKSNRRCLFFFVLGLCFYFFIFIPISVFKLFEFDKKKELFFNRGITLVILVFIGYKVILEGFIDTYQLTKKNKKFTPNVHVLMTLGAFGAVFLENFNEAIFLIIIFAIANFLEEYIERKSQSEIKNLLKIAPTQARLLQTNGDFQLIEVEQLKIGDKVVVLGGDKIPSDGIVVSGSSFVDESSITGESIPVDKKVGDKVFGSNINRHNTLIIEITATSQQNIFHRIIELSYNIKKNISKKATLIKRIEPLYVKIVIFVSILFVLISQLINLVNGVVYFRFNDVFYKSIVFLTVASPCALAVADVPATFTAISYLAKNGILLKSGNSLSHLAHIDAIVFDKTGTLTSGRPLVKEVYFYSKISNEQKLEYLKILYQMEQKSNHPLAFTIKKYLKNRFSVISELDVNDFYVNNLIGIGIEATYNNDNYRIAKYSIFKNHLSETIPEEMVEKAGKFLENGYTVLCFSCNNQIVIVMAILDVLRLEAQETINYFSQKKIKTIMLTGDNQKTAYAVSKYLNIDYIFSECLPEEKSLKIKEMKENYPIIAMVGDGINDAPALASADVGIAMQEGTDFTIDIADIILIKNNLKRIILAHKVALKLNKIIWQNIIFAILIITILSLANFVTSIFLPWAVFLHEISTILVLFNSLRIFQIKD
ncbi:MAG: heavy metal translocating P-type ATPase [Weeping tea tree witches'-broom phytoplasma]|uniref:heavy metal translocating P-type ATPase n=1 Tax=Candidatus Phytoplasma melaleucae TaxID=2982630 RepID=UPI00293AAFFC|nr:heavy metal translocating P-type ATPase [Weeping tea tree witches'-broom phytoplasma]